MSPFISLPLLPVPRLSRPPSAPVCAPSFAALPQTAALIGNGTLASTLATSFLGYVWCCRSGASHIRDWEWCSRPSSGYIPVWDWCCRMRAGHVPHH
eukprot:8720333-Pyramimonas_sp.AAC.1